MTLDISAHRASSTVHQLGYNGVSGIKAHPIYEVLLLRVPVRIKKNKVMHFWYTPKNLTDTIKNRDVQGFPTSPSGCRAESFPGAPTVDPLLGLILFGHRDGCNTSHD